MTPLRTEHTFPKALLRAFKKKESKSTKGYTASLCIQIIDKKVSSIRAGICVDFLHCCISNT